jgi:hypothetical protein
MVVDMSAKKKSREERLQAKKETIREQVGSFEVPKDESEEAREEVKKEKKEKKTKKVKE